MDTGDIVEHKSKESTSGYPHDKHYLILSPYARMKNPTTQEWVDAVIYEDSGHNLYIREKRDFNNKFKKVVNESKGY